jgi:hypothetical protein
VTGSAPGALPALHAAWVADLVGELPAPEPLATCESCAMCASPAAEPAAPAFHFDPHVKCCGFLPELPNFVVGRILDDPDPALARGRESVARRIAAADGVDPLGLRRSARWAQRRDACAQPFGRNLELRCPHFVEQGARCGIWPHREAVCATWFCKHERAALSRQAWRCVRELLEAIERDLAHWCARELGARVAAPKQPPSATPRPCWGPWRGRELAFFAECARLVGPLRGAELLSRCRPELPASAQRARDALRRTRGFRLPGRLRAAACQVEPCAPDAVLVWTDSPYDPLRLPRALADALERFDGRPLGQVLAELARERGVRLRTRDLRELVDAGVLQGAGP